jgi:hypothetical protein
MQLLPIVLLAAAAPGQAAEAPAPSAVITLGSRQAAGTPVRAGFTHTGGGNVDVQQPAPDTVVLTLTGVAVAGGHPCKDSVAALTFELVQDFEVGIEKPEGKKVKLTLEARVIGLLRSHDHGGGSAEIVCPAHAVLVPCGLPAGVPALAEVSLPGRAVAGGENLSVNDRQGPVAVVVPAGKFTLHQRFGVQAAHPKKLLPCKAASAEFAPDPALDPLWISYWEPFHGANKKDFGFQVTLRVAIVPDKDNGAENGKKQDKK